MTGVLKPLDLRALYIFLCIKVALVTETAVVSGFLMILMDECISDLND